MGRRRFVAADYVTEGTVPTNGIIKSDIVNTRDAEDGRDSGFLQCLHDRF
jgi:hypothetical protein